MLDHTFVLNGLIDNKFKKKAENYILHLKILRSSIYLRQGTDIQNEWK